MASQLFKPTSLISPTSCIICVICDSPLINEAQEAEEDVSGLKCGHVFHKNCLNEWLSHRETCPNCRLEVTEDDVVPKLYFNSDEGQAAEFSTKVDRQPSSSSVHAEDKPWYEKYKEELLIGGGALLGFAAGAIASAMLSAGKQKSKGRPN